MTEPRMPQLQGNPIWFNLSTPDPQGAKDFYSNLFGWEWADVPMSSGNTYHMAIKSDANIAGMSANENPNNVPSGWINSVYVEDAEEIVERIKTNGGSVISSPHNADGWGVSATVATPEGAIFGLWQSLKGHGVDIFGEPGAVCWIEYHSHDLDAAKQFYSAVFECGFQELKVPMDDESEDEFTLTMIDLGAEQENCAFVQLPDQSSPATWATYFMVEDIHASVAKAQSLGAELTFGIIDVPPGSFAVMLDPQGVPFSFWQPAG